jgi:hydroxyacylglutathione hydrolase
MSVSSSLLVYDALELSVYQLAIMQDNYVYILRDESADLTAVVDPGLATPVIDFLTARDWPLQFIYNTHHHSDHVGGNSQLVDQYACQVLASSHDANRIPCITQNVDHGAEFLFGRHLIRVIMTPGHTLGHIVYHLPQHQLLFCGDTIFGLGCGRLFEGSAEQMWKSLCRILELPDDTLILCAHEYTLANARFLASLAPIDGEFQVYLDELNLKRSTLLPTVPSTLATEKRFNPFLKADDPDWARKLGLQAADPTAVFAEVRRRKDQFR